MSLKKLLLLFFFSSLSIYGGNIDGTYFLDVDYYASKVDPSGFLFCDIMKSDMRKKNKRLYIVNDEVYNLSNLGGKEVKSYLGKIISDSYPFFLVSNKTNEKDDQNVFYLDEKGVLYWGELNRFNRASSKTKTLKLETESKESLKAIPNGVYLLNVEALLSMQRKPSKKESQQIKTLVDGNYAKMLNQNETKKQYESMQPKVTVIDNFVFMQSSTPGKLTTSYLGKVTKSVNNSFLVTNPKLKDANLSIFYLKNECLMLWNSSQIFERTTEALPALETLKKASAPKQKTEFINGEGVLKTNDLWGIRKK